MTITEKIIRILTPIQVAKAYIGEPKKELKEYSLYKCPFHNDNKPSLRVFHEQGRGYYCHACGAGGNVVQFVEKIQGKSNMDACRQLDKDFKLGVIVPGKSMDTVQKSEFYQSMELKKKCLNQLSIMTSFLEDEKANIWCGLNMLSIDYEVPQEYLDICSLLEETKQFESAKKTIEIHNKCLKHNEIKYKEYILVNKRLNRTIDLLNKAIAKMNGEKIKDNMHIDILVKELKRGTKNDRF